MILTRSTRLSQPADAAGVDSRFGGRNDWLIAPGSPGSLPISGVVPTIPGQYGRSHYFDGASLQMLGNAADVNATGGQFTLLAYAKFDGTSDDRGVVGNRATTGVNAYAQIVHRAPSASRRIVFTYKGTSASAEVGILSAELSIPPGSTQLVAMVVNGTSVRCYVGAELVGSGVSTAPAPSGHLPYLRAGNYYDNITSRRFRGGIYYSGLLPVALSGEDIGALARNPWKLFRPVQRRVYFDMGAGGGATSVASDLTAGYAIQGAVSSDAAASYSIRGGVSAQLDAQYDIRISAFANIGASYDIRGPVSADVAGSYTIRGAASSDSAASYDIRGAAYAATSPAYDIRGPVNADLSASYEILSASSVTADSTCAYPILGSVGSSSSTSYGIRGAVASDRSSGYAIRGTVLVDLSTGYAIEAGMSSVYADLSTSYAIEGPVFGGGLSPADITAIRSAVRTELTPELTAIFQIQTKVDAAL